MRDPDEKHDAWRNGDLDPPWWFQTPRNKPGGLWMMRRDPAADFRAAMNDPAWNKSLPQWWWSFHWDNIWYGSPLMKQEYERR